MSKVSLTVRQIMNLGLWDKVCEYKHWSPWIYNEGQIDENEIVDFDDEFKQEDEEENFEIEYGKEYIRKNIVYSIIEEIKFEYNYEDYTKYLVAYRNLDNNEINFEIKDKCQLKGIVGLKEY